MHTLSLKYWGLDSRKYSSKEAMNGTILGFVVFALAFISIAFIDVVRFFNFIHHKHMSLYNPHLLFIVAYLILVMIVLLLANHFRTKNNSERHRVMQIRNHISMRS